jgi:predicted dehydrogenase
MKKPTRRNFIKSSAAIALTTTALSTSRVLGANERINVGMIGYGLIGRIHTRNFKEQPDVNVAAVAETYRPRLDAAADLIGGDVTKYSDFRRMLDNKSIDAVVIATPDHWHALMTMMACAAGKDVYVEKPLTLFVNEGRWMIDVAKRHKRIVQVGTQQRSGPHFQRAKELVRTGRLGQLVSVQNHYFRNVSPGFGTPADTDPPRELDWDLWLGPAPMRPYNPNRAIYHFRWFWDYSGGQMTNLGQHSLDIVHWMMNVPVKSVYSTGGRFYLKDNCEVPDTQDVILEYPAPAVAAASPAGAGSPRPPSSEQPGFTVSCQYREASAGREGQGMGGLVFQGTHATMPISRLGYEIIPDPKVHPINTVSAILGGHPIGGPQPIPEPKDQFWTQNEEDKSGNANEAYKLHARNFLDSIKSRQQPLSDLESAHQTVTACHLSNISLKTGRKLNWDSAKQEITADPQASSMLTRAYRSPWDKELKALRSL